MNKKNNPDREALTKELEILSREEEQLGSFLKKGKEQEKRLAKRLDDLKKIIEKEMQKNKQNTQEEVKIVLEKKNHEISEYTKKKINQKKSVANETVKTAEKLVYTANLDGNVNPQDLSALMQNIEKIKTRIYQIETTEKQIEEAMNGINKEINAFIKKYPQHLQTIGTQEVKKGFFASRKEKIQLKIKKRKTEKELKQINEIISHNLEILPLNQSAHILEILNQTKDFLRKPGITSEEIDEKLQIAKTAFEQTKAIYPLKEQRVGNREETRVLENKKEKLKNLIHAARKLSKQGYSSSEFTEGGALINLSYEAEDILQNNTVFLDEINKIDQKLEQEIQKIKNILDKKTAIENEKIIQQAKTSEEKTAKIINNKTTKIDDAMLKKIQSEMKELSELLSMTEEDNKKMEEDLHAIQLQKQNLEKQGKK